MITRASYHVVDSSEIEVAWNFYLIGRLVIANEE
jgi:hypothetical protein